MGNKDPLPIQIRSKKPLKKKKKKATYKLSPVDSDSLIYQLKVIESELSAVVVRLKRLQTYLRKYGIMGDPTDKT